MATQTPIVLSSTFVNGQWMEYFPQTTVDAVETTTEKQFISATEKATYAAAESNANAYTDAKIAALVDSAPEALDTLAEIAAALNASDGAHEAILQSIGEKAATTYVNEQLALKADAATVETRFTEVEGSVTAVEGSVGTLTSKVTTLEEAVALKVDAAELPKTTMGETAPETAPEGSIFLKVISPVTP